MIYPFEKIRKIRAIRKRKSELKLNAEKALLAEADRALCSRENELAENRQHRSQKERSLYDDIIRKPLSLDEFAHFRLEIDYMREKEQEHVRRVEQAQEDKEKAAENVDEALRVFFVRNREKIKIDEHRTQWSKQAAIEEDRRIEDERDELGQAFDQHNKRNE